MSCPLTGAWPPAKQKPGATAAAHPLDIWGAFGIFTKTERPFLGIVTIRAGK
jgi:hypothetical protein